jgi:hypothetical protein
MREQFGDAAGACGRVLARVGRSAWSSGPSISTLNRISKAVAA